MGDAPGTVSRILWHFTGGPTWNASKNRQSRTPKPAAAAYSALLSILRSHNLKTGQYQEVVNVRIPKVRVYNPDSNKYRTRKNVVTSMSSSWVCCLADIPVIHLSYQASRYGKFAIGFHRDAAIRHGFNPVFYSLDDTSILRSIFDGFGEIEYLDGAEIRDAVDELRQILEDPDVEVLHALADIRTAASDLEDAVAAARTSIERFLAFVKTFTKSEFKTIYCEREWRATRSFHFDYDDVAMIVLPKTVLREQFFEPFMREQVRRLKLPRSIPIVPWEDLVES